VTRSLSRIRSEAFRRQAGRCFYCSVLMWTDDYVAFAKRHSLSPRAARRLQCTAEHLQARQNGGRDTQENIVAACLRCNQMRHRHKTAAPDPAKHLRQVKRQLAHRQWNPLPVFERGLLGST